MSNNKSETVKKIVKILNQECVNTNRGGYNPYSGSSYFGQSQIKKDFACLNDADNVKELTSLFKKLSSQMGLNVIKSASLDDITNGFVTLVKSKAITMKNLSNNEEPLDHKRAIGLIMAEFIKKVVPELTKSKALNRPEKSDIIRRFKRAIEPSQLNKKTRNNAASILKFLTENSSKLKAKLTPTEKDKLIERLTKISKNNNVNNFNREEIDLLKKMITGKIR